MAEPCYTCRRRHIQCDRSQTPCLKCQKAGLECLDKRPVRWVQGVAIRGTMRGRSYQNTLVASRPVGELKMHSISTAETPSPSASNGDPSTDLQLVSAPPTPSIPSIPPSVDDRALYQLDESSQYYLDYYNQRICQLFIVYDSQNNPFRSLIPLAFGDKVLLDAMLALAARHRANFEQPFSTSSAEPMSMATNRDKEALRFKYRAIQGLAHSINTQHPYKDGTVASVFLLVFLDLLESGCDRWNYHLEGAKNLMALKPSHDPGRTIEKVRKFIIKQIHLIEALGATFVRPKLLNNYAPTDHSANMMEDVVEESFLGCPEYILTSVQFFSLQRDMVAGGTPSDEISLGGITPVLDAVKQFDCYTWASSLPQESVRDIDDLCKLARVYQLGAILYGGRVLDAIQNVQTNQKTTVSELIGVIDMLQRGSDLLKCALWPIVVAGLECHQQSQRNVLIQAMEEFWADTKCLNVSNAAKILQGHWKKIDDGEIVATDWIFDIGRSSHDWLLI
ncbi:Zn(II)2Cys6 transcription factor [Aspergillus undulatus]|uniref:Zn(II)2Cys6 transcription factor n=1 Tax=Aspergillus undulatus TaxID=1810928 RepID=UPI003CCDE9A3